MALREWWAKIKEKPLADVIRHKHKFVVMDTDTFKEKFSFQLSGINLFVVIGITVIAFILLTTVLIAFTPLREFIPGYTDTRAVELTYNNARKIDSLEHHIEQQEWLIATMQAVLNGEELTDSIMRADSTSSLKHLAIEYRRSKEDSLLRQDVEESQRQIPLFDK